VLAATCPASGQQRECTPVELQKVQQRDLSVTLHAIGTLQAVQEVMVKPEIGGTVRTIHFREGQRVQEGDLLISLDDSKLQKRLQAKQAGLRESRARMKNARRTYERQQNLYDRGLGSEEARDEALTAYTAAQAMVDRLQSEIEELEETIEDMRIRAPFDGMLGECLVDSGDVVQAGTPLVHLVRNDRLEVSFTLPQKHVSRLSRGQRVSLTAPSYPERTFGGEVDFLAPVITSSTRSLRIKATVDNPEGRLLPGGFASVQLSVDKLENAAIIPEEALIPTRKGYMVFLVQNGTARAREVRIGLRKPGIVELREGVEIGQTVIASGHISVRDGSRVCGVNGTESAPAGTLD
jgi:membrane fusion protein (multidrug efflux system)